MNEVTIWQIGPWALLVLWIMVLAVTMVHLHHTHENPKQKWVFLSGYLILSVAILAVILVLIWGITALIDLANPLPF